MARNVERLTVEFDARFDRMEEKLNKVIRSNYAAASKIENSWGKTRKTIDRDFERLGSDIGRGLGRASLLAGVAFGAIAAYSVKAASDAGEIANAFDVAFGEMADDARAFGRTFSQEVGRSFIETQESMSRARLVLDGFGFSGQQALDVVKQIQARSVDIGSLFNVEDADAFAAIISGLTGEAEPMKRFGVVVNETAVKAELLRLGFKGNTQQASEQAKVVARLNIILRGTAKANGDAARTADSTANQMKRLRGEVRDSAAELGTRFLPVADKLLKWANDALKAFNDLSPGMQNAGLAMVGLVAAGGPIAALVGGLTTLIKYANAARKAMLGIGASGGAAGAAGGAGATGGAAVGGLGLAGTASAAGVLAIPAIGIYSYVTRDEGPRLHAAAKNPGAASSEDLLTLQGQLQRNLVQNLANPSYSLGGYGNREETSAILSAVTTEILKRAKEGTLDLVDKSDPDLAALKADAKAASEDAAGLFGLSPDQLKPVSGKGTGKSKAQTAAEKAAKLATAQDDRFNALLGRANDELLAARQATVTGADERLALELAAIDNERQVRAEDLKIAVSKKELTQAQADQVAAAEEAVRAQQEANARAQAAEVKAREALALKQTELDGQIDLLSAQSNLARTAAERRDIELRILDLLDARERAELEAVIASQAATEADKEIARRKLAILDAAHDVRADQVRQGTQGPLEDYFASLPRTMAELNERSQELAANGMRSLEDAIVDIATGASTAEDALRNFVRQMLAEFTRLSVQQIFASASGAQGGNFLKSAISFGAGLFGGGGATGFGGARIPSDFAGLYADGTDFHPGGLSIVGERGMEAVNIPRGAQVIPNDVLRGLSRIGARADAAPAGATTFAPTLHVNLALAGRVTSAEARRTGAQIGAAAMREMARARKKGIN